MINFTPPLPKPNETELLPPPYVWKVRHEKFSDFSQLTPPPHFPWKSRHHPPLGLTNFHPLIPNKYSTWVKVDFWHNMANTSTHTVHHK